MVTGWRTVLSLSCYDCDSTHQHYDVTWFEYALWRRTMHEWVMNIHYQTWIAQRRFINMIGTPSKQWGVCDNTRTEYKQDISRYQQDNCIMVFFNNPAFLVLFQNSQIMGNFLWTIHFLPIIPLYYAKLCASFQSHRWIQTGVTAPKRPICVRIDDLVSRVTLKFDRSAWKTIGHLFTATSIHNHSIAVF